MNAQPQLYYAKLLELHRKQETGTGQGSTEKQKKVVKCEAQVLKAIINQMFN